MMPVSSFDGDVATIRTSTRKTEVNVEATAKLALSGRLEQPDQAAVVALALGFTALKAQCAQLRADWAAAAAGEATRAQAVAMQEARRVLAGVFRTGVEFFEVYDRGEAPDEHADKALRDALSVADNWLVADSKNCEPRRKIIDGGT